MWIVPHIYVDRSTLMDVWTAAAAAVHLSQKFLEL